MSVLTAFASDTVQAGARTVAAKTPTQAIFVASPEGFRQQNAGRKPEMLMKELVQNAMQRARWRCWWRTTWSEASVTRT